MGKLKITTGSLKRVKNIKDYKYATEVQFIYEYVDDNEELFQIIVPTGFLSDGASSIAPDWSHAWLFHDYLYATHSFTSGQKCSRKQADDVMIQILRHNHLHFYEKIFKALARSNFLWRFSKAWDKCEKCGPEFI